MSDLLLEIESVTDMNLERAAAVGRAYDADPELRPLRVGADPARIKVESSLEELIRRHGLPIDWLTVRTNSRKDGFEGGGIVLRQGRGGYIGWAGPDGTKRFTLVPNTVDAGFLRSWADGEPGRLDRVAALFARLCEAIDGFYGVATVLPRKRSLPPAEMGLVGVGWLNYFGPAFAERFPKLARTGAATTRVANGGVVIRVAREPWDLTDADRRPVVEAVGRDAILQDWGPATPRGLVVPSYAEHMRHSPGSMEMPWVSGERKRYAAKAEKARERRHAAARRRRDKAQQIRAVLPPVDRTNEWSTSFDTEDWRSFGQRLFRRLGGELAGPIGRALVEEIASAPLNHEESVVVTTEIGAVEVRWFIDDVDDIDIYLFGPTELPALIDTLHERWSEG